jgi:hypothetical protein
MQTHLKSLRSVTVMTRESELAQREHQQQQQQQQQNMHLPHSGLHMQNVSCIWYCIRITHIPALETLFRYNWSLYSRMSLKCDGTLAETRFRLSAKRTSPFKSAGASVPSTTGSLGVRISGSNAGTPCSEVVWRVLATHSIRQFPLHFPSRASPCAINPLLNRHQHNPYPSKGDQWASGGWFLPAVYGTLDKPKRQDGGNVQTVQYVL